MKARSTRQDLFKLAKSYGLQIAYYDMDHRRQQASIESLVTVLNILGAPINRPDDASHALREYNQEIYRQPLEPVSVLWDTSAPCIKVRITDDLENISIQGAVTLENGEERTLSWCLSDIPAIESGLEHGINR